MAAGNVADAVNQPQQNQTEAQTYAEYSDFRTGQHSTSTRKEHQKHCAHTFSDVFSHKLKKISEQSVSHSPYNITSDL